MYLLEAPAVHPTRLVNINTVFKNFTPRSRTIGYGIEVKEPLNVNLGGNNYKIALFVMVLVNVNGGYNPVFNLSINNPKTINTVYGEATGFNYGHRTQFYLLIYGDAVKAKAFEKWFGF